MSLWKFLSAFLEVLWSFCEILSVSVKFLENLFKFLFICGDFVYIYALFT